MNAPTLPLLDEQTEQELQPPCEGFKRGERCDHAAEWILAFHCACRNEFHMLLCGSCMPSIVAAVGIVGATCMTCFSPAEIVGTTRL